MIEVAVAADEDEELLVLVLVEGNFWDLDLPSFFIIKHK